MSDAKKSDSGSNISTDSSWTVLDEKETTEEAPAREEPKEKPFAKAKVKKTKKKKKKDSDIVFIGNTLQEQTSSTILETSSSTSTIKNFLETEDSQLDLNKDGFLSVEEMIKDEVIEHDYDFDGKPSPSEDTIKKSERKYKNRKKKNLNGECIGTLSIVGTVLAVTGLSFICMLVPNGSVAPDNVVDLLSNPNTFSRINNSTCVECPVFCDANYEQLHVMNAKALFDQCKNNLDTTKFEPLKYGLDNLEESKTDTQTAMEENKEATKMEQNEAENLDLPETSFVQHHHKYLDPKNSKTGMNHAAVACNIIQDMLLLNMTSKLRKKKEDRIKRLKKNILKKPALAEKKMEEDDPKLILKKTDTKMEQQKDIKPPEDMSLFKELPFNQTSVPETTKLDAKRKILTAKRKTNIILRQLENRPTTSVTTSNFAFKINDIDFGSLKTKLKQFERRKSIETVRRRNRENFEELKKIRMEYEVQMRESPRSEKSAYYLEKLKKAREKYIEHLKKSQDELVKQIKHRRENERNELMQILKERRERQYKDASSGSYDIPVFDNLETRKRLKELKEKETKLCDLVYGSFPQCCFNDIFDCECKFRPSLYSFRTSSLENVEKNVSQLELALEKAQEVAESYRQWSLKWREQVDREFKNCASETKLFKRTSSKKALTKSDDNLYCGVDKDNLSKLSDRICSKLRDEQMKYIQRITRETYKYWEMKRKYLEKRTSVLTNAEIIMKNMLNNYKNTKSDKNNDASTEAISNDQVANILDSIINEAIAKKNEIENTRSKQLLQEPTTSNYGTFDQTPKSITLKKESCTKLALATTTKRPTTEEMYAWLFGRKAREIRRREQMLWYFEKFPRYTNRGILSKQDPSKNCKTKSKKHTTKQ